MKNTTTRVYFLFFPSFLNLLENILYFKKKKRNSDEWRESRTEASGRLPQPRIAGFFPKKKKRKAHSTFAIEDTDIRVMWCTFRSNLLCRVEMLFVSPCWRVISRRGGRARAATAPSLFFNKGFSADSWSGGKRAKNAKKKKSVRLENKMTRNLQTQGGSEPFHGSYS